MGAVAAEPVVDVLTGRGSSVYYALGVALASNIARTLPQAKISVVGSRGSIENLERLQGGRGEIAFALGDALVVPRPRPHCGGHTPMEEPFAIHPVPIRFGVDQARRGWLSADDVINTRSIADLRKMLRR